MKLPAATRAQARAFGLVILAGAILGFNVVVLKVAVGQADPTIIQAASVTLASVLMLSVGRIRGYRFRITRRDILPLAGSAMAASVVAPLGFAFGVQRVDASVAALLLGMTPIFALVLGAVFLGERHGLAGFVGVSCGFVGVGLVALAERTSPGRSQFWGVVFTITGSLGWGGGLVVMKTVSDELSRIVFIGLQAAIGAPILVIVAAITTGFDVRWGLGLIAAIVYLGILAKGVAWLIQLVVVRVSSPVHASTTAFLVPLFGLMAGVLVLGESLVPTHVVGAAFILGGIALVTRVQRMRSEGH